MCKSDFRVKQLQKEKLRRIELYLKNANSIHKFLRKDCNAIVYCFEKTKEDSTVFIALGFKGRKQKPTFHYRFKNIEDRDM